MKYVSVMFLLLSTFLLTSCSEDPNELRDIDISLYNSVFIMKDKYTIYELKERERYFEISENKSVTECESFYDQNIYIVGYKNKYYHYKKAIEMNIFTEEQSIFMNIASECSMLNLKEQKGDNCGVYDITLTETDNIQYGSIITIPEEKDPILQLGEYDIYEQELLCAMYVGDIIVDGYYFGSFGMSCSKDLNGIGYYAVKDDIRYGFQDLVDADIFTVEEVYNMFLCIKEAKSVNKE